MLTAKHCVQIQEYFGGSRLRDEVYFAVGADAYCRDAAVAVETAKDQIMRLHNVRGAAAGA